MANAKQDTRNTTMNRSDKAIIVPSARTEAATDGEGLLRDAYDAVCYAGRRWSKAGNAGCVSSPRDFGDVVATELAGLVGEYPSAEGRCLYRLSTEAAGMARLVDSTARTIRKLA